nr:uncharacterized protein LOC109179053 [Ipomoea batatas]
MRPSGASDAYIVVRALEEYKQKYDREKFGYEHVWAIVKDLPSWQSQFVARQLSKYIFHQSNIKWKCSRYYNGSEEVFPRLMGKKASKRKAKERYSNNDDDDDIHAPTLNPPSGPGLSASMGDVSLQPFMVVEMSFFAPLTATNHCLPYFFSLVTVSQDMFGCFFLARADITFSIRFLIIYTLTSNLHLK